MKETKKQRNKERQEERKKIVFIINIRNFVMFNRHAATCLYALYCISIQYKTGTCVDGN